MTKKELLRGLPKIDEVMKQESLVVLSEEKGDILVTDAVRAVIASLRASILDLKDGDNKITSTMHAACDEGIEAEDTRTVNVRKTTAPTTTPTTTTTSQPNKTAPAEPSVQTGDVRNVWVYMLICFAAVGVFAVAYGRKREG